MTRSWRLLKAALAVAAMHVVMGEEGAVADGAVAVGSTGDVVKHGIAFGMVVNEPKEKAADMALARCRAFVKGSSAEATARCKVMATFSRECFAVAYDPQPATPGAGWGVGKDQIDANLNAMKMCEATAGPGRARFCQVESGSCDTAN
jgi:predicted RecA/RadA family phage recombinase